MARGGCPTNNNHTSTIKNNNNNNHTSISTTNNDKNDDNMNGNNNTITANANSLPLSESDVPAIQLRKGKYENGVVDDVDDDDDDDAAVFLQLLGPNYAVTARSRANTSRTINISRSSNASRNSLATSRPPPTIASISRQSSRSGSAVSEALSRQKSTRSLVSTATRVAGGGEGQLYRLLSAKRNHIQQLSSDLSFLHARIKELEEQNRLLVRVGKRQEAALTRYHDMKSELPHILEAHKMEINVLQEKLRRANEENRRGNDKLRTTEGRLLKVTEEVTRLRELSRRRHLPERDQLNQKLSATTLDLQEKEKETQELSRRVGILDKAMKQQVQAEVARHRTTSKKLFNLQRQHHQLQDTLKEREAELEVLRESSTTTTTAPSSRSGSLSARHPSARTRGSGSSATSGVVSALDQPSASDSRGSIPLEANGRLPPISIELRRSGGSGGGGREPGDNTFLGESPEPPTRRTRHRTLSNKDGVEERRPIRMRRRGRSPRVLDDGSGGVVGGVSATPSPATTPEPHARRSDPDGDALDDDGTHPGLTDHRRRQRLAATLNTTSQDEEDEEETGLPAIPTMVREFSLIENYPPRERMTLNGGSSGGSDSAASPPPPSKIVPPLPDPRVVSRPAKQESPRHTAIKRRSTVTAADLRTFSSLSKLDSASPPKPTRSAITP